MVTLVKMVQQATNYSFIVVNGNNDATVAIVTYCGCLQSVGDITIRLSTCDLGVNIVSFHVIRAFPANGAMVANELQLSPMEFMEHSTTVVIGATVSIITTK